MAFTKKGIWIIVGLILATGGGLALVESQPAAHPSGQTVAAANGDGLVSVEAAFAQSKVMKGSAGNISMALLLKAAALPQSGDQPETPVDLVVVLDRSGSMEGDKISDARDAVDRLISRLTDQDRLALVTYANDVRTDAGLMYMDGANRDRLRQAVSRVETGGGTNLGGGLGQGINLMLNFPAAGRQRKVILISDGLANHGIVDPQQLGCMASEAVRSNFSVSSVGVGYDFNETLMTTLADAGAGQYYFLENPEAFARVFEKEFQTARQVAAAGISVRIPQPGGVRLVHAGGYPIAYQDGFAVFHPGDLLSGQARQLFLTFVLPTDRERRWIFDGIQVQYRHQGLAKVMAADVKLAVACVADPSQVAASVDEKTWSRQVLQEDFGRLKASVAEAIRKGEREAAMAQIQSYETTIRRANEAVGSAAVQQNIDSDLPRLKDELTETFSGAPAAVEVKRKQQAKALQYDSYKARRDHN